MRTSVLLLIVIASVPVFGQSAPPPATASHGFDLTQLDRSADPCVDFYQYACGGWRAKNPLPDDKVRWGRYDEMAERNREKLRTILEAAAAPSASRSPIERQVGDYYAACMDESLVEQKGRAPLQAYFDRIDGFRPKPISRPQSRALHRGRRLGFVRVRRRARSPECEQRDRSRRSGRARSPRPRLLPQDGSEERRAAREVVANTRRSCSNWLATPPIGRPPAPRPSSRSRRRSRPRRWTGSPGAIRTSSITR